MKIRYRCDHQMAIKKRVRQVCDKKCSQCMCAIWTDEFGNEGHNGDMRDGCGNFQIRNMKWLMGRDRRER